MSLLGNLFGRRRTSFCDDLFARRQSMVTPRRAGMGLGTLAAIAAPFVLRRLRARRAQNAAY